MEMQYYFSVCDYRDWDFRTPGAMRAVVGIKSSAISSLTGVRYQIEVSTHVSKSLCLFPILFLLLI